MSVVAYVGKPGSGKSYSVVEHVVIPALKAGRTVYHNMMLEDQLLYTMCGDTGKLVAYSPDCSPADLVANAPFGAVVVIDESLRYWPSGTRANKIPVEQLEFFTKHRHRVGDDGFSTDIVIICQELGTQCCSFIRALVEYTYVSIKLSNVGWSKSYRVEVYQGAVTGDKPPASRLQNKSISKYRKEIYDCYKSHTQSQTGVAGLEVRDGRATIWKNWKIMGAIAALVLAPLIAYLALHSVHQFTAEQTEKAEGTHARQSKGSAERSEAPPSTVHRPPSTPSQNTPQQVPSKIWRLAGEIVVDRTRRFVLDSPNGARYLTATECRLDPAGNRTCIVDGELVAEWTGTAPAAFNQWFQASAGGTATP